LLLIPAPGRVDLAEVLHNKVAGFDAFGPLAEDPDALGVNAEVGVDVVAYHLDAREEDGGKRPVRFGEPIVVPFADDVLERLSDVVTERALLLDCEDYFVFNEMALLWPR